MYVCMHVCMYVRMQVYLMYLEKSNHISLMVSTRVSLSFRSWRRCSLWWMLLTHISAYSWNYTEGGGRG